MEKMERIELLDKVARTINHDINGEFVRGETQRLDLIEDLLKETEYQLTVIGLCHLYSKVPFTEITEPITVISSHIDTHRKITEPFSEIRDEKRLYGTYDNSITNAAVLTLMLENRLPDSVVIAFTGNEEYGMEGARNLSDYLIDERIQANVIVVDVTDRGYKGKNVFSFENSCHSNKWTSRVKDVMNKADVKWKLEDNYEDDETCVYSRSGFECFSFCIPTKGKMHDNSGLKTRISTYNKYIEALCLAASTGKE